MAYEVTATRLRPQQFSDLIGQDFVAETLKNSIKTKLIFLPCSTLYFLSQSTEYLLAKWQK